MVAYESAFHKGERDGLGNSFSTSIAHTVNSSADPNAVMDRGLPYWIDAGTFIDDQMDGAVQQSCEREVDHDAYGGKEPLYAGDGRALYSGKWRNGDYNRMPLPECFQNSLLMR
jgi:hypothetical protein